MVGVVVIEEMELKIFDRRDRADKLKARSWSWSWSWRGGSCRFVAEALELDEKEVDPATRLPKVIT